MLRNLINEENEKVQKIFREIYNLYLEIHKINNINDFNNVTEELISRFNMINLDIFELNHQIIIDSIFIKLFNFLKNKQIPDNIKDVIYFLENHCLIFPYYEKELTKIFKNLKINYIIKLSESNIKPLPTNDIIKNWDNNIESKILSMRYKIDRGVSILDLNGNFVWMDKYSENIFENKIINNTKTPLNFLNLITFYAKQKLCENQDSIIDFKNFNETIIKYSIYSKKNIKKFNKKNNQQNYFNCFKFLSSKIYILKMSDIKYNKQIKKNIKDNIDKFLDTKYFLFMITRKSKTLKNKYFNENDLTEFDLSIINNIIKGIKSK